MHRAKAYIAGHYENPVHLEQIANAMHVSIFYFCRVFKNATGLTFTLTEEDFAQLGKCRRPHNRLGFAYQVVFVRLFDRFPQQQPFELFEELVCFSAAQLGLDVGLIELYRKRQPTISEHQQTITGYLGLRPFDDTDAAQLEQFLFEEVCRLEQAAALMGDTSRKGI